MRWWARAIARAAERCGLPHGVFSMLHGSGLRRSASPWWASIHEGRGVSPARDLAGRALFDAAAARPEPIPVFAEMSSLNPLVLLPGALRERGAQLSKA